MRYRCQACECEVHRGWLPSATCGMYFIFLLGATVGMLIAMAWGVRQLLPERPPAAEPSEPMPWWGWVIGCPIVLLIFCAINWLLELIEYLIVRRKPCPNCGAKRWSRGYTGGFGL